ncbi:MAG: hypothetical protein KDJ12_05805, partial [Hyphomicrobiales bacterium]|nr:hypothetical protein [Hyphomicrobiales bacterium]
GRIQQFEDRVVRRLDSVSNEIDSRGREASDALHARLVSAHDAIKSRTDEISG